MLIRKELRSFRVEFQRNLKAERYSYIRRYRDIYKVSSAKKEYKIRQDIKNFIETPKLNQKRSDQIKLMLK